jgi:hypothetical protein
MENISLVMQYTPCYVMRTLGFHTPGQDQYSNPRPGAISLADEE